MNLNDKAILLGGYCLTDKHISFAQSLLKKQFPLLLGSNQLCDMVRFYLQIGYKFYWFVVTTGDCCKQCSGLMTV